MLYYLLTTVYCCCKIMFLILFFIGFIYAEESISSANIQLFDQYEVQYGLKYNQSEKNLRKANFEKSRKFIDNFNLINDDVQLKVNQFSDWTDEEYTEWLGQAETTAYLKRLSQSASTEKVLFKTLQLPTRCDWREGKVTKIKNQLNCGSCWAFATVSTVESAYLIKHNQSLDLAEQELVDCGSNTQKYYNKGCQMGFSDIAFDYIHDNGLVEETFYPYHAQDQKCDNETLHHHKKFFIKSYNIIPFNSTDELIMEAIHNFGPVSAAINADSPVFRHYSSGIIRNVMPGVIIPNHVIAIVGYDTINGTDVFILRNSWGTGWGNHGYAYLARSNQNQMGINNYVVYPVLQ